MTPDDFQRALASADAMAVAGREPAYWCGFKRGLQRAHLGRRFSSNTDHYAWLDFSRDDDPFVAQLGRGYRAGLQAVVSGRPLVLDGKGQHHHAHDGHVGHHRLDGHAHGHDVVAAADDAAAATDPALRTRS
jgi:hypothetical protein